MKRALSITVAGLIGCASVPAQEYLDLTAGQELTLSYTGATLEYSAIVVGSGGAFDYGNRLFISNGGDASCSGSMYVNGTVSTGLPYEWLYSYVSINGAGSALNIGGDLSLWSPDLPHRYPLDPENPWAAWGVPCHMEISENAAVSVAGDMAIINRSHMSISSGGRLNVGSNLTSSEGALNIASNGLLEMQLGEHTSGTRLSVGGDSYLDGGLDIVLPNGVSPAYGDEFDLFNWNGEVIGTFASTNTPILSEGLYWDTSALYTTGSITVIPEPTSITMLVLGGGCAAFIRRSFLI